MRNTPLIIFVFLALFIVAFDYVDDPAARGTLTTACTGIGAMDTSLIEYEYDVIDLNRVSTYYPSLEQCASRDSLGNIDSSSNIYNTADGSHIDMTRLKNKKIYWCALPASLIVERGGSPFHMGDSILLHSVEKPWINRYWTVHDVMSDKWGPAVDLLMHPVNNKPKLGIATDVKILYNRHPVWM